MGDLRFKENDLVLFSGDVRMFRPLSGLLP